MELFLVWIWSSITTSQQISTKSVGNPRDDEAVQGRIVLEILLTITLQQGSSLEAQEAVDSLFTTLLDWIEAYQGTGNERQPLNSHGCSIRLCAHHIT